VAGSGVTALRDGTGFVVRIVAGALPADMLMTARLATTAKEPPPTGGVFSLIF
jgi:hypothetical protein